MIDLVAQHLQEATSFRMKLLHVRDFLENVTEFFVEEEDLFLQEFILTRCRHLAHSGKEYVNISCSPRLDKICKHRLWHVSLLERFSIEQRGRCRLPRLLESR